MTTLGIGARDLKAAISASRTSRRVARRLVRQNSPLARAVWADMFVSGDRDAVVCTFIATTRAAAWARRRNVRSDAVQSRAVMATLAQAHGFDSWCELQTALRDSPIWPWIDKAVEDTSLAKRMRQELFSTAGVPGHEFDVETDQDWGQS